MRRSTASAVSADRLSSVVPSDFAMREARNNLSAGMSFFEAVVEPFKNRILSKDHVRQIIGRIEDHLTSSNPRLIAFHLEIPQERYEEFETFHKRIFENPDEGVDASVH